MASSEPLWAQVMISEVSESIDLLHKEKGKQTDSKLWAQVMISEVSENMDLLHEEKGKHDR